ncbi:MAG: PAS domain-containing protein [Chloroflexi bacterium]|nr:PAS domain-containing protein [Chloroflexota bacterium]
MNEHALTALDNMLEGCQVISHDWRYVYVNDTVAKQAHRAKEELIGHTMMDRFPGIEGTEMFGHLQRCMKERVPHYMENEFEFPDGRKGWFELRMEPVPQGVLILSLDITERKNLAGSLERHEQERRQSEKMESLGQLAGGVAHDFNNLLTAVLGYSRILADRLTEQGPERAYALEIERAAERGAALTSQLLAFSRSQPIEPRVLDLNSLVAETEGLLRRVLTERIALVSHFAEGLWRVKADPYQLDQVIINLAANARDAMPDGGTFSIETANVVLDQAYVEDRHAVEPGEYVLLSATDTGVGMDRDLQQRIFEPFFTTKQLGKGTGLGLSTAYGIVKQNGGEIFVYSEIGLGTAFKIYLPRAAEALESSVPAASAPIPAAGGETVLVAEDQEPLRILAREVLESAGYRVLLASDGAEALAAAAAHDGPIHLLLSDVVMPGLLIDEVVQRFAALHPRTRVLLMSGYPAGRAQVGATMPRSFIQKPFGPRALLQKVREVLDAPAD